MRIGQKTTILVKEHQTVDWSQTSRRFGPHCPQTTTKNILTQQLIFCKLLLLTLFIVLNVNKFIWSLTSCKGSYFRKKAFKINRDFNLRLMCPKLIQIFHMKDNFISIFSQDGKLYISKMHYSNKLKMKILVYVVHVISDIKLKYQISYKILEV